MEDRELNTGCGTAIIVTAIVLFIIAVTVPFNLVWGKGEHKGYITAVDTHENFLSHTTTVYFKTNLQTSQEDMYCINNESTDLIDKAKQSLSTSKNIVLKYENLSFTGWFNCSGDVIREIVVE